MPYQETDPRVPLLCELGELGEPRPLQGALLRSDVGSVGVHDSAHRRCGLPDLLVSPFAVRCEAVCRAQNVIERPLDFLAVFSGSSVSALSSDRASNS